MVSKDKDLTGQRFGMLTVLESAEIGKLTTTADESVLASLQGKKDVQDELLDSLKAKYGGVEIASKRVDRSTETVR